jgi:MFS transporter, SP family, xylose:H+ symportor
MHSPVIHGSATSSQQLNIRYIWLISIVAALGGLLFGYDWVVIGGAKVFYEAYFHLTTGQEIGWANSCALGGCLVGSILSGASSNRFGRKNLLILSAILFALSSVMTGWAGSFRMFILWRMIGGVAIGVASNVSPVYIAEISPSQWRGRLVSLNQMTIVIGILLAQVVNLLIAERVPAEATAEFIRQSWNGQYGWRWMFTAVTLPSIVFFLAALFVPESPRWLTLKGKKDQAFRTLSRIGGDAYASTALADIESTVQAGPSRVSWKTFLTPRILHVLSIGVILAALQQWSGINIIFNYADEIYRSAGYSVNSTLSNIVITGVINLLFTFVALRLIDRVGRRPLMLFGCAGIGLSHFLIGLAYSRGLLGLPILILTLCTIGCYAMSLAPVTWVIISEIFPNQIRGTAVSLSVSALWIASFLLTFTFPVINQSLGPAKTFWLYAAICLGGFAFTFLQVPETKCKTLEQIEMELSR